MKLAVFSIGFSNKKRDELLKVVGELLESKHEISLYQPLEHFLKNDIGDGILSWSSPNELKEFKADFLITLGGDGTFLQSVTYNRESQIPLIGINLGRLGFLASVDKNQVVEMLSRLEQDRYFTERRSMVHLDSNLPIFGGDSFALNECSVLKRDSSSMIIIHSYLDGKFLNTYWCDGLLISTPTGSTAYNLSCGGPILYPTSNNFIITPVAPHNLNVRPLVVPDNVSISLELDGRGDSYLCTLDSRKALITKDHKLSISREKFDVHLVRFNKDDFVETMRAKLNWGYDSRNW